MKRICVFCGSSSGASGRYGEGAGRLGRVLARKGIGLVYGGGGIGLMGILADSVLEEGGEVWGVIPKRLATRELAHTSLTRQFVVETMHERKARMAELADAFVALPGGYGTYEELFEVITWAQLGIHRKAVGLLNLCGYFNELVGLVDKAVREGFIAPEHRRLLLIEEEPEALLERLATYQPPKIPRIIGRKQV